MSNDLQFVLKMQDQASGAMRGFDSSVDALSGTLQGQRAVLDQLNASLSAMSGKHKEAAEATNKLAEAHHAAAEGAKEHAKEDLEAGRALERIANQAKEAAEALIGMWASNEMARSTIEAAEGVENAINRIARASGQSKESVEGLHAQLEELSKSNGGFATTEQMEKMAVAAARLGGTNTEILAFADAISKISSEGNFEQITQGITKVLQATGEGAGGATKLADALAAMEKHALNGIGGLLPEMERLSGEAAELGLSSEHIAAYAASFEKLGGRPEMTMMAFSRTMQLLKQDAEVGGDQLRVLAQQVGMTEQEFKSLEQANPEAAFLKLLSAVQQLQASGKDPTNFLSRVGISNEQTAVIVNMAKHLQDLQANLKEVDNAGGAATKMASDLNTPFNDALKQMKDQWEEFKASIGKDEMDTLVEAFKDFTSVLKTVLDVFSQLSPEMRHLIEIVVIGTPAFIGITKAVGALSEMVSGSLELVGMFGDKIGSLLDVSVSAAAKMLGFGSAARAAGEGGLAATTGLKAVAGELGLAEQAAAKASFTFGALLGRLGQIGMVIEGGKLIGEVGGALANKYLPDSVKNSIVQWRDSSMIGKALVGADNMLGEYTPAQRAEQARQKKEAEKKGKEATAESQPAQDPRANMRGRGAPQGANQGNMLGKEVRDALDSLDTYGKKLQELTDLQKKLDEATAMLAAGDTADFNAQQLQLMQQKLNAEKMMADPLQAEARAQSDAIAGALAYTKQQQDRLAVEKEIRKLEEEGALNASTPNDAAHNKVRSDMGAAQAAERQKSYQEELTALNNQLALAGALTQAEKERLQVEQQIAALGKDKGYSEAQLAQLKAILEATKQIEDENAQFKSLNPQAEALSNYNAQLTILNQRLAAAKINQEEYNREKAKLDNDTLAARDPIGAIVQSQQEEIAQLGVVGQYRQADLKTLQQITELKKQGVLSDDASSQAIAAQLGSNNRMIQDVQDMQKNLDDLTSSFGSGLSQAIGGALNGQKYAFDKFFASLGQKMMDQAFSYIAKSLEPNMGGLLSGLFGKAQAGTSALSGLAKGQMEHTIQSAQTTINAANVTVNGAVSASGAAADAGAAGGDVQSLAPSGTPGDATKAGAVAVAAMGKGGIGSDAVTSRAASPFGDLSAAKAAFSGATANLSAGGRPTADALTQHLMQTYGLSREQATGAVGVMGYESGNFQTLQEKGHSGYMSGYGYAQWTGPRRQQYFDYAKKNGLDPSSYEANQGFLDHELQGNYRSTIPALKATNNPQDAANAFEHKFEGMTEGGPGVPAFSEHMARAQQYYDQGVGLNANSLSQSSTAEQTALANALKNTKPALDQAQQTISQTTQAATQSLTGLTGGIGDVGEKALSAVPSMGSLGTSLTGLIGDLTKSMGSTLGGVGGLFAGVFHSGGAINGTAPAWRSVSPLTFVGARRFHDGLGDDEFPAILQRGERVLTANQDQRASTVMARMADAMANQSTKAGEQLPAMQRPGHQISMVINTKDASSFRYSQTQIMAHASAAMSRASTKHS